MADPNKRSRYEIEAARKAATAPIVNAPRAMPATVNGVQMNYYALGNGQVIAMPVGASKSATGTVDGGAGPGAAAKTSPVADRNSSIIATNLSSKDLRVRIKVPVEYQKVFPAAMHSGIIFPYTPQISVEHRAEYTPQTPLHSNYALNFYKNSMVSDISIQGIFTVQNDIDAIHLLGAIHLLRALTKGRFGDDPFKGSPPPICRLYAYGAYMLDKVPVVISSFKQDFPSDVDYYHFTERADLKYYGEAFVPTRCTISIVCKPMFSRNEMLRSATVPQWLDATNSSRKTGIL
jgi:hypothetical protein